MNFNNVIKTSNIWNKKIVKKKKKKKKKIRWWIFGACNIYSIRPIVSATDHSKSVVLGCVFFVMLVAIRCYYENTPIEIYWDILPPNFRIQNLIFFMFLLKIYTVGTRVEPPRQGGSNEYPQSMFFEQKKRIMYTSVNPSFTILKGKRNAG